MSYYTSVGVGVIVALEHRAGRESLITMGFGRMDHDVAEDLAARLRAEGIGARTERVPHNWRVAVPQRDCDRATELAEELGLI